MKNYKIIHICVTCLITVIAHGAPPRIVADPVADYIKIHSDDFREQEDKNEHVIKLEVDLDNDGKIDIFLSSEKSALLTKEYKNNVRCWDLYKNVGGGKYSVIDQQKSKSETGEYYHSSYFLFDAEKFFIGNIKEINSFGILATYYLDKKNLVYFSSYTLRDGYFEEKNFPDENSLESDVFHRDDNGNIPDLPDKYQHYFTKPPTQKVVVLSQKY